MFDEQWCWFEFVVFTFSLDSVLKPESGFFDRKFAFLIYLDFRPLRSLNKSNGEWILQFGFHGSFDLVRLQFERFL